MYRFGRRDCFASQQRLAWRKVLVRCARHEPPGLSVAGTAVSDNPPPNTTILVPGIGSVTLNEQTCDDGSAPPCSGSNASGIRVRAIHVIVTSPNSLGLPQGVDVIVGEAHADSSHR